MKVALITGACPPGLCGVGDYAMCLANALNEAGAETHLVASGDWNLRGAGAANRRLREQNFDVAHIQYPTFAFGAQLGPQGLSLLQRCVVTVHEASQRHILRRLALLPFSVRSRHIIFTSRYERQYVTRWAPWISRVSSVIPVGSNIPVGSRNTSRTVRDVIFFGLIAPGKGLEDVLALGALISSSGLPLAIRIIGGVAPKYTGYFNKLQLKSAGLPVFWDNDLGEEQIAERLAGSSIAYLPYPDGASERRTTLKAALLNGMVVITTRGPHTPDDLDGVVRFCRGPEETLAVIRALLERPEERLRVGASAVRYGKQYTWERIAKLHLEIYHSVLAKKSSRSIIETERTKMLG